ncbi:MAG: aminomethyltransferase family protein [Nitrospiria bacterium]
MQKLEHHDAHCRAGAQFAPYGEWELPEHYGDVVEEYRVLRNGVGLSDLSFQGHLLVSGADHVSFLQKLISNDMALLSKDRGIYTTLLTSKGKVLSDFFLYPVSGGLLLEVESQNALKTKEHLLRFKLRSQVKIEALPWGRLMLSGPQARPLLENFMGAALSLTEERSFIQKEWEGRSLLCIKQSITGEEDYHLYLPEAGLAPLWEKLLALGQDPGNPIKVLPIGQAALEILRIEEGKPRYGKEISEDILPVEAGLQKDAISYTKGCYPGQEVVARIRTYGHVNKNLYGLVLEGSEIPERKSRIFVDDKNVGWITSAVWSPLRGKVFALCYLRSRFAAPGHNVEVEVGSARMAARTASLPFETAKDTAE